MLNEIEYQEMPNPVYEDFNSCYDDDKVADAGVNFLTFVLGVNREAVIDMVNLGVAVEVHKEIMGK